jgi:hypothetical protein
VTPGFRSGSLLPLLSGRVRRDGRNGGLPDDPEPQLGGELLECRQADPDLLAHEPGQGRHLDPGPPGQLPDGQPALPDRLPDDLGRGERSSWVAASSEISLAVLFEAPSHATCPAGRYVLGVDRACCLMKSSCCLTVISPVV